MAPGDGNGSGWASLLAGLASVATLPVAIYLTRFSDSYELIHAGFAIPVAAVLGLVAISLARRCRRGRVLRLAEQPLPWPVRVGRLSGSWGSAWPRARSSRSACTACSSTWAGN